MRPSFPLGIERPLCKCLLLYLAEFMKTAPAGKCHPHSLTWLYNFVEYHPHPPQDSTEFDSDFPLFLSFNCFYETEEFLVLQLNGFYQQQLHLTKCSYRFWGGERKVHAPFSTTTTFICLLFFFCFVLQTFPQNLYFLAPPNECRIR